MMKEYKLICRKMYLQNLGIHNQQFNAKEHCTMYQIMYLIDAFFLYTSICILMKIQSVFTTGHISNKYLKDVVLN